ncbi:hypothetical protein EI94DRAFT_1770838 [Lactarius quietus]|nr:hypothetical protein EI94DRAFT_1770838 [Lactarius quietus]
MLSAVLPLFFHLGLISVRAQTYSATYLPSNTPNQSEDGQIGTNQCGTGSNQTSLCQNAYINSVDDFCVFAPPDPGPGSVIGNTEQIEVAWCIKPGYGTRLIPDGTITGAHFVHTPDYVQVTGIGDLTKLNIPQGDAGGELDPHGATGNGNPIGGLVFSNAFTGQYEELHEWTNFVSASEFCFRGCQDGAQAPELCQHIYDEMGCDWNMPGNYDTGFDQCDGDDGEPMGVYSGSTFYQGDPATPAAHPAPGTSSCTTYSTIGNSINISSAASTNSTSSPTPRPTTTTSSSVIKTSSGAGSASKPTSAANAASVIRLPGSGVLVSLVAIVAGTYIF